MPKFAIVWDHCKRILVIRADNMGDVIMTTPALRALKETFHAPVTLLTSSMAHRIVPYIPFINEVIVADLPWVKGGDTLDAGGLQQLISQLRDHHYNAAVIFTVYSQSALPAAMLAMLAGIPRRLAYCRENPYGLLTDWIPDGEPYRFVQHQVERDLKLVGQIGAFTNDRRLSLSIDDTPLASARRRLQEAGIALPAAYVLLHPGVSEVKRQYPLAQWQALARLLADWDIPMLVTGTAAEHGLAESVCAGVGKSIHNAAGLLSVGEFIALVDAATLVVTVNTATVHIAAARQKPVVVLYALTNPQHTPWLTPHDVLYFPVPPGMLSRNEVVSFVHDSMLARETPLPLADEVARIVNARWHALVTNIVD